MAINKRYKLKMALTPYLFLSPAFLIFGAYLVFPFFYAFGMSLFRWAFDGSISFAGFRNYAYLFTDKLFGTTVLNTLYYTAAVPFKVALALGMAVLLNQKVRFETGFRGILFFPNILSNVVVALIWQTMFTPNYGFINTLLGAFGIPGQRWLVDPSRAMFTVFVVSTWKGLGANLIIFIAGLKVIPGEYYEAASIDGASPWQAFRYITLPCLRPAAIFVTTMTIIGSFKVFDLILIMTGGGPGNSTKTFVQFIYELAFNRFQFGRASAAAFVFFVVLFALTSMQRKVLSSGGE